MAGTRGFGVAFAITGAAFFLAALAWAGEAVRRIRAGVFWPPAPEVAYDRFASLAPEGLARALGSEWEKLLAGGGEGAA